ncbi:MAG: peptidoglycan DD-metalloendopeptidase family protein [Anaerobacillus sp.]|uniref:peptidoglycan DD-metalloendopeptidase family protein n=1 Tax=Anaerobacillus sp. TaxID=1872506 RepID=UPI00391DA8CB
MESNNNRLDQLQEKLKSITDKSLNSFKQISTKYKKALVTSLCIGTILTTSVHTDNVKAEDTSKLKVETIYHVYVDDSRVGSVDNKELVDSLIAKKIEEYSKKFSDIELVVNEDIKLIPEVVFKSRANSSVTLSELENKITIKAEAVALKVEGKEVAYLRSEEDLETVIKDLKLQYVSEEELAIVMKAKEENTKVAEPKTGESAILAVELSKEIEFDRVTINPTEILSIEDTVKQLNLGTLEDDVYVVEPGDVLGTIAQAHGLSVEEVIALNPEITENSLLQIGDELNVTIYEPIIKVIVEEASVVSEEVPFQTETKEDSSMWRGDTKIEQTGEKGERIVSYLIARENGRTISRKIVSEEVTKEPKNHIVVKGTKVSPSRGSGKLAWPAVGGYISSYQGTRWGRFHRGIDIARPTNTNILAADNGTVSFAGWDGGYGNKVIVNHNNGMTTLYAHLASIDVNVGDSVAQGQKIGVMGKTGNSTGVHLHFEVYQDGDLKNPMDYLNR